MADRIRRQGSTILVDVRKRILPKDVPTFLAGVAQRLETEAARPEPTVVEAGVPGVPGSTAVAELTRENEALRAQLRALETMPAAGTGLVEDQ